MLASRRKSGMDVKLKPAIGFSLNPAQLNLWRVLWRCVPGGTGYWRRIAQDIDLCNPRTDEYCPMVEMPGYTTPLRNFSGALRTDKGPDGKEPVRQEARLSGTTPPAIHPPHDAQEYAVEYPDKS
jgi:hypothetical protein